MEIIIFKKIYLTDVPQTQIIKVTVKATMAFGSKLPEFGSCTDGSAASGFQMMVGSLFFLSYMLFISGLLN